METKLKNGYGFEIVKNDLYIGNFIDNKKSGIGIYYYKNQKYIGEFENNINLFNGYGTKTYKERALNKFEKHITSNLLKDDEVFYYKEFDETSYRYDKLNEKIQFKYKNNCFYINEECVMVRQNDGCWRISV